MAQVLAIGKNHFQVVFKSKSESIGEYLHELRTVKEFRKGIPKKIPAIKKTQIYWTALEFTSLQHKT